MSYSTEDDISIRLDNDQFVNSPNPNAFLELFQQILSQEGINPTQAPINNTNTNTPGRDTSNDLLNPYLSVSKEMREKLFGELFKLPGLCEQLIPWLGKTCCFLKCFEQQSFYSEDRSGDRYAAHLIGMTRYVLTSPYAASSSGFIEFYNNQPESNDFPIKDSVNGSQFSYPNTLFCYLLNISQEEHENEDVLFKDLVYSAFPCGRWKENKKKPPSPCNKEINLPLNKMKNLSLDFERSIYCNKHLELDEHKVMIFSYDGEYGPIILNYEHNLVAQSYGIETVGKEIIKTYTFLMKNKESKDLMIKYKLWINEEDDHGTVFNVLKVIGEKVGYSVLADKFFGLEKRLDSFRFRFQSEVRERRLYKPVDYYFIMFSVVLGLATLVQTITAIISLALQIKSL
ncbi:hypothetical protein Glove_668g13 [Diversispora epigaea]|uniref:Uncharacterized protein n=1 Tax=Diversispora epigaea TaxID=1348612 RepID=A0A397G9P5_9GLOM|nr:hypothetical protein Glove_668g13 [Diversispora epigaea]